MSLSSGAIPSYDCAVVPTCLSYELGQWGNRNREKGQGSLIGAASYVDRSIVALQRDDDDDE